MAGEKIRVVHKFGTGHPIPPDARYLSTVTQTSLESGRVKRNEEGRVEEEWVPCWLVWHYYEVEIDA